MAVEYKGKREVLSPKETFITIQIPAVASEGDLLICVIAKDDNVAVYNTGSYGDWNMLFNITDDSQTCLYVAWRIATADDVSGAVSWTWNFDDEESMGEILCYSGANTDNPIHASGSAFLDSSATPTAPSVAFGDPTPLTAGSLVLQVFGCDFDDEPRNVPSQLTTRFNAYSTTNIGGAGGDRALTGYWLSPTGFNDPNIKWSDEADAYDNDTETYARCDGIPADSWSSYLELTISAISCSKVRFNAYYNVNTINQISLDVYYSSAWHNIYEGAFVSLTWTEKEIGSTQTVTALRVKFYNDYNGAADAGVMEADFWKIETTTGDTGTAVFGIPASNEWTAATLVIEAASAAGIFYKSLAGVFTATGAIVKLPKIPLAGVLNPTGSISSVLKKFKSLAGAFSLTGNIATVKKLFKSLSGTVELTGVVNKLTKISLSGVFSLTGTIGKLIKKGLSGTFNLTGTLAKKIYLSLSGIFNFSGSVSDTKKMFKSLAGVFSATGTVGVLTKKTLVGAFDLAGDLASQLLGGIFYKSLAGTLTLTGGVSNVLTKFKSLAGSFDFSGSLNRLTKKTLAGVFSATGTISSVFKRFVSLAGSFDLTGSVNRLIKKSLSGIFGLTGSLNKLSKIALAGSFGLTGEINTIKKMFKALVGTFNLTGSISILTKKVLAGSFDLTGNIARKIFISLSGAFNFIGNLESSFVGIFYKTLSGTMTLTGDVNKLSKIMLGGVITSSGSLVKKVKISLTGVFDFSGSLGGIKRFIKTLAGVFDFTGSLGRLIKKTLSGSINLIGFMGYKRFYTKIIKALSTYIKIDRGASTHTKIDKDISTYTKVEKVERGWFKGGWFTAKWFKDIYIKIEKELSNYTKVNKE